VPGISDVASSSDTYVSDALLKTKLDEKDEKLRIMKSQENEKYLAILAKEQAQACRVKELAARDRAKNEELEDKTMRLALIEAEGIKNVVEFYVISFSLIFYRKVTRLTVIFTPICRRKEGSMEAEAS
jgi:hypothetical protein